MSERRLPIYARWTLAALGHADDATRGRPICPVASWLLAHRPALHPHTPDPDRLSAIRARTAITDALLLQIRDAASAVGRPLSVWSIGAGFDARWARLSGPLSPVVQRWVEVEEPRLLATKRVALLGSPFEPHWSRVRTLPVVPIGWGIEPEEDTWPVVVLDGLLHRVTAQGLRTLLARIREATPRASVLLDLTGVHGRGRVGWSARRLERLGWSVVDDVELAWRDVLFDREGEELCAGMVPVRVLHLVGREPSPITPRTA